MQQQKSKERLALAISITLTAGAFSIVPAVAEGAPVLVSKSTGVTVDQTTTPKVTDITSTERNNIIRWQEFSVAKGETVQFDKGEKTNNYLNLVTGANRSEIYGAIKGGQSVYVVNPHGVLFGADASVNVGNLYVSTRSVDEVKQAFQQMAAGGSPLAATAPTAATAGDVVNLGTIKATSVVVEGKTVKFMDAADVAASNVTLAAQTARIGTRVSVSSKADAGWNVDKVITRENFGAIKDAADLKAMKKLSGDYELANDITGVGSFTPIGENTPFTGKFNGNFHTVSGFTVSNQIYGGLFGQTSGATIKNLGVTSGSVSAGYAGGIAGKAQNTTFKNVYNAGVTVVENMDLLPDAEQDIGSFASGGLIGQAIGVTIDTAYNTAKKGAADDEGGTIVGILSSSSVKNVYNLSDSNGGRLFAYAATGDVSPVSNVYTSGASIVSENYLGNKNKFDTNTIITDATSDKTSKADYKAFGTSISDSGSDSTVWRIYEGKTQPLLRAFLRRSEDLSNSKGVTLSYDYTHGSVKGSYDGKGTNENPQGLTVTYNAKDLVLDNITADDGTFSPDKVQRGGTLHDATVWNSDDTLPTANKTDHNGELYFWSAQDGYDLINDKVFILPREVDLQNALNDKSQVSKEYDGSKALSKDAIASLFEGSESSGKGIIKGDDTAQFDYSSVSGTFDNKNVGTGKVVTITGGVSLKNSAGYHNYAITSGSTSFNNTPIKGTITPHKLKVALSNADLNKTYDGTNLVRAAITQGSFSLTGNDIQSEDDAGNKKADDVSLAYVGTGSSTYGSYDAAKDTFDDTQGKDAGTHEVKLTGLKLSGADADNYILVDAANENNVLFSTKYQADGTEVEGGIHNTSAQDGGALYASGTIKRREILSDGTLFGWKKDAAGALQSATREYTGDSSYDDVKDKTVDAARITTDQAATTQTGLIAGDDVKLTAKSAVFTVSTDAAAAETKNAGQAKGVRYTVDITGEDAKNYTLDHKEIAAGQTGSVLGKGSITPRTIYLAANRGVDKTYDGDNKVRVNGQVPTSISPDAADSLVGYAKDTDAKHRLVNGDGAVLSLDGSTYEQADVRYAGGLPAAQQITYKVSVMQDGTVSSNYKINTADNAKDVAITKLQDGKEVTGTIRPRTLTDLTFKDVSKTYDGKAAVRGLQATDKVQLQSVSGIQQLADGTEPPLGDLINLDSIQGTYGKKNGDTFTENQHVKDAAGSKEKDVRYTNIQLKNAEGNYNFGTKADGRNITETTAYGKGEIKPLEITDKDTISLEKLHDIGKTYDGTTDVADATHEAGYYVGNLTAQIPNSSVDDRITLGYTVAKASYANKNQGKGKQVTYALQVTGDNYGDYTLSDTLKDGEGNFAYDKLTGDITPRVLKGTIVNTHTTKEYDGTKKVMDQAKDGAAVTDSDALVRLTAADGGIGIVEADRGTVKNASTASYRDQNVHLADGKTQSILYQLELAGNDAGNYVFQNQTTQLEGEGTITPREVTPKFAALTKIFDNTTAVFKNADKTAWTTQQKPSATLSRKLPGDDLALSYDAAFADKNAGTENHVDYTHLVLSGAAAGNYQLADTVKTEQDGSRSAVGTGTINAATVGKKDIIALFDSITKIYDGSSSVAYDHTAGGYDGQEGDGKLAPSHKASDYLKALSILGIKLENGVDYDIKEATYRDASGNKTEHAGGKHGATQAEYTLELKGNALKNFTFGAELGNGFAAYTGKKDGVETYNGTAFYQNGVLTERPTASIQAKYVLAQNTDTSLLEKTYDGTTALLSYVDGKNGAQLSQDTLGGRFAFTGILAGDSVKGAAAGEYADKNVVHTANVIGTIDINYKLSLQNNKAGDYQLVKDTKKGQALTDYTGKNQGRINPRQLDFAADYAEREFDGTADAEVKNGRFTEVRDAQGQTVADTGLVSEEEKLKPGTDVKAQYGGLQNGVFVADGNVNGKEDYKGIRYEGLKQALEKASGQTEKIKASNYTIADTRYFDEAKQQGKIKRLALSARDIKMRWEDVVKQYDGTTVVKKPEEKFLIYIDGVHQMKDGIEDFIPLTKEIRLQYDLKDAAYDAAGAGKASSVTYNVSGLTNSDKLANNFTFTNPNDKLDPTKYQGSFTLKNDGTMWKDGVQSGTSTAKVGITKRVLRVHAEHNDKIYDGNADADKSKLVLAKGTDGKSAQAIQEMLKNDGVTDFKELVEANYMAMGAAQETDAEANVGAKHDASQGEGGKVIKYTLDLTKKDGLTKNYALDTSQAAAADGVSVTNQVTGTETKGTYSGHGDILRRVVYVSFEDPQAENRKEYDGTPTVTDKADDLIRKFALSDEDAANKTGIIRDDTGRVRVTGATGTYDTAHVKRGPSGNVLDGYHTVTYQGFTLKNADGSGNTNYELAAADGRMDEQGNAVLVGKGTITPATLHVSLKDANVTKVYDATRDVKDATYGLANVEKRESDLKTGEDNVRDAVHITLLGTPQYDNKNANVVKGQKTENRSVTYELGWDNTDYELALAQDAPSQTLDVEREVSATGVGRARLVTNAATITPETVTAALSGVKDTIEKTYDGNATLPTADLKNRVTFTGLYDEDQQLAKVAGVYDTKDVAWNADGTVGTKNILYTPKLEGTGAANYELALVTPDGKTLTGVGQGLIKPRQLTITAGYAEKIYDGTADAEVLNPQFAAITGVADTGLAAGELLTPGTVDGKSLVTAQYGVYDGENFTPDANVEGDEAYKAVAYQHLQQALENAAGQTATIKASNYTIADTVYFDQAKQQGKIKRLALTARDIKQRWGSDIQKQYDGTRAIDVKDPKQYLTLYITGGTGADGRNVALPQTLTLDYDLDGAQYNSADVRNADAVTYHINGVKNGANITNNFRFDDGVTQDLTKYQGDFTLKNGEVSDIARGVTVGDGRETAVVAIKKRVLKGEVTSGHNDKIYNGETAADSSFLVLTAGTDGKSAAKIAAMLQKDGTTFGNLVQANYIDAQGHADASASTRQGTKQVRYTVSLTDALKDNYAVDKDDTTKTETSYDGFGDIFKRVVYVDFANDKEDTKTYDGYDDVKKPLRTFALSDEQGDTGIIKADQGKVHLDTGNITGKYASAHVKRAADGTPVAQQVSYRGFGVDNANYEVRAKAADGADSDTLVGMGTITPAALHVGLRDATVTQAYDNTLDVEDLARYGEANVQLADGDLKTVNNVRDTVNVKLSGTPQYDKKDANVIQGRKTENRSVTYELTWDNPDYELAVAQDVPSQTLDVTEEISSGGVGTARLVTDAALITPRTVTLAADPAKTATRLYDGASGGAAEHAIGNLEAGNLAKGEKLINLFLAPGATEESYLPETVLRSAYDSDPNAGRDGVAVAGDRNDLRAHTVTYNYTLQNPNYQLDATGRTVGTASGQGVIRRRDVTVTADPVTMAMGHALPVFTGGTSGFIAEDAAVQTSFESGLQFRPEDSVTAPSVGTYGVYGWYRTREEQEVTVPAVLDQDGKTVVTPAHTEKQLVDVWHREGNLGLNYYFQQDAGNDTALTVTRPTADWPRSLEEAFRPAQQYVPDGNAYHRVSYDTHQETNRTPTVGIEYAAGGLNVGAAGAAAAALEGGRDVVNLGGTRAAVVDVTYPGAAEFVVSGERAVPGVTEAAWTKLAASEARGAAAALGGDAGRGAAGALATQAGSAASSAAGALEAQAGSGSSAAAGASSPAAVSRGGAVRNAGVPLFYDMEERQPSRLASTAEAQLFGDAVPAAKEAAATPVKLFADDGVAEHAAAPARGTVPELFDDAASAAAEQPSSDAIEVTTSPADEDDEQKEKEEAARAAALQAKGAAIGIESEGAGVNLAG
ncbi:YDG domain-containing protein [Selenomonas bovis]|uniref:YDG domain-containing protein n=1 Tax=Selenomonas bovis TaxID=416586 RepID=UPI003AB9304C